MPSTVSPRRLAAPLIAVLSSLGTLIALRGISAEGGLVLRPDFLLLDGAALLVAAGVAGAVAAAVAGDHVPGAPARALALGWAALGLLASASPGAVWPIDEALWPAAVLLETLVLIAAALVNSTACWLVDTRINFPRLYPDPADRPPGKHTSPADLRQQLLPHALLTMLSSAIVVLAVEALFGVHPFAEPLAALLVGTCVYGVQRVRPARGSLWTMLGMVAGHGVALASVPMPEGGPATSLLFGTGLMAWAGLFARSLPSR